MILKKFLVSLPFPKNLKQIKLIDNEIILH
jgi:hypothetical protein